MKKSLLIVSIFIVSSLMIASITSAASTANVTRKPFGGKIINKEAIDITTIEATGFKCAVPGDTFDINPVYGPTGGYLVPAGVEAKGGGAPSPGKWTLGFYSSTPTIIECTKECTPYVCVETVSLNSITLYGLSKN